MNKTDPKRERELAETAVAHRPRLISLIRARVRDQLDAEDVYQDVMEEFVESYDLGVVIDSVGAWLSRVAQNKIVDRFRRKRTRDEHARTEIEASEGEPLSEDEWQRSFIRARIADALEALPPELRDVYVRNELEGQTFEEIALETGININTLLSRKRHAAQFLRDFLKETYDELE